MKISADRLHDLRVRAVHEQKSNHRGGLGLLVAAEVQTPRAGRIDCIWISAFAYHDACYKQRNVLGVTPS